MTIEVLLIIIAVAIIACYLVFRWQDSVINTAIPPYQEPVKPDMVEQWKAATKADTFDNIDSWNAKVGDKIWHKEAAAELEPSAINPQAAWPFPQGPKP
jgi:hypothetical protein